jgi:hypothetical protein
MPKFGRYEEGIDFEWRDSGHGYRTRHFFTSAEKQARTEVSAPEKPKASPRKTQQSSRKRRKPRKEEPATPLQRPPRVTSSEFTDEDAKLVRQVTEALDSLERQPGRSRGAGGPSNFRERAEAQVAKTRKRPWGAAKETVRQRRAYDRLKEEGTLGPERQRVSRTPGRRTAPTRHPRSFNKGGLVKANCGASMKAKRGK